MALADFFLIIGLIILIGFLGKVMRRKTMVPESLFLIIFGILLGPVTGIASSEELLEFVPLVSVAAMVAILVESGIEFDISRLRGALIKAAFFTIIIAALTTAFITFFLVHFFGWDVKEAALLGLISSGTTTITAMALLKSINVSDEIRRLILLETIINDFTLIIGTFIIVEIITISAMTIEQAGRILVSELSVGIILGIAISLIWRYVLTEIYKKQELSYISTLGICFVLYYLSEFIGGNPIISIFTFSLFLGSYQKIFKFIPPTDIQAGKTHFDSVLRAIRYAQTDITFFLAASFFVLLGVTFDTAILQKVPITMIAGIIGLILLSRFLSSHILSSMDKRYSRYRWIITVMIPRGYVAAVLAFVPAQVGVDIPLMTDIVVILIITTTVIAILGTVIYAILGGKKSK